MNQRIRRHHAQEEGFALLILIALFISFALVAGAIIDRSAATKQIEQDERTQAQLSRLSRAIIQYSLSNNGRYPCPASYAEAVSSTTFGTPVSSCESGTPAGIDVLSGNSTLRGMVPVRALVPFGIDPNDVFDQWNNRIMYVVDRRMTKYAPGISTHDRPTLAQTKPDVDFSPPDFIVLSYGRDGLGAIPKTATQIAIDCPTDGSPRAQNCDGDANFVLNSPIKSIIATTATYADDLLSFYKGAGYKPCAQGVAPSWTVSTKQCSHSAVIGANTGTPSGDEVTSLASDTGGTGSANAVCNNGSWEIESGATCN